MQRSGSSANAITSSVVPIQPRGSAAPLFMIHGRLWGTSSGSMSSPMLAATDRPAYRGTGAVAADRPACAPPPGRSGGVLRDLRSERYKPTGPYYLLGILLRGRRLVSKWRTSCTRSGEQVELLGMLDAYPRDAIVLIERNDSTHRLDSRIARRHRMFDGLSLRKKTAYLREKLNLRARTWIYTAAALLGFRSVPSFMKNTFYVSRAAAMNYRAKPWPGRVTVFRASIQRDTQFFKRPGMDAPC